jgi:hypothetical protein
VPRGYLHDVDAGLHRVSRTPQPDLLKDGGRLASSLGAAGEGPGRFSFNAIGEPRPGNVQRLAKLLDNGALRGPYPTAVSARRGRVGADKTLHTRGNCSCGCRFGNSAAILLRRRPGGFVRLPTWLSRR